MHPDNNILAFEILGPVDRAYSREELERKFERKAKDLQRKITHLPRADMRLQYALRVVGDVFHVEARVVPDAQPMLALDEHTARPVLNVIEQFVNDYPDNLLERYDDYLDAHSVQNGGENSDVTDPSSTEGGNARFFDDLQQLAKDDVVTIRTPSRTLPLPLPHPAAGPVREEHFEAQIDRIEFAKLTVSKLSVQRHNQHVQPTPGRTRAQLWLTSLSVEDAAYARVLALQAMNAQHPLPFHARQLPCKRTDRHLTLELIGIGQ